MPGYTGVHGIKITRRFCECYQIDMFQLFKVITVDEEGSLTNFNFRVCPYYDERVRGLGNWCIVPIAYHGDNGRLYRSQDDSMI